MKPTKITIEITTRCNLFCEMCFLTGIKRKNNNEVKKFNAILSLNLFKKIIDEIVDDFLSVDMKKPFSVTLNGEEIFLHPEIFNMLSYARKRNLGLTLVTNSTLIDADTAKKIIKFEPEALIFSIDGPEKIHDKIRGQGNFQKTCLAIKFIQEEKIRQTSMRPKIFINSLINNLNVDYLDELIFICEKIKITGLFFSHIQWFSPEITGKMLEELNLRFKWIEPLSNMTETIEHNLYIKKKKIENLLENIKKIKNYQKIHSLYINFLPNLSFDEIRLWYSDNIYKIDNCNTYKNCIRIGVNGEVYPACPLIPFPWGNVENKSIKEILNYTKARTFFTEIENHGFFYACHHCRRRSFQSKYLLN